MDLNIGRKIILPNHKGQTILEWRILSAWNKGGMYTVLSLQTGKKHNVSWSDLQEWMRTAKVRMES